MITTRELFELEKRRLNCICPGCGASPIIVIEVDGIEIGVCPQCHLDLGIEIWNRYVIK
jgi:Zn finger protein HypA/HybF involved in hydrogenase expression